GPRLGRHRRLGGRHRRRGPQAAGPGAGPRGPGTGAGGNGMSEAVKGDPTPEPLAVPPSHARSQGRQLLSEQRRLWRRGEPAPRGAVLRRYLGLDADAELVLDLIYNEVLLRQEAGQAPRLEEYLDRFPHLADPLRAQFEVDQALGVGP